MVPSPQQDRHARPPSQPSPPASRDAALLTPRAEERRARRDPRRPHPRELERARGDVREHHHQPQGAHTRYKYSQTTACSRLSADHARPPPAGQGPRDPCALVAARCRRRSRHRVHQRERSGGQGDLRRAVHPRRWRPCGAESALIWVDSLLFIYLPVSRCNAVDAHRR